MATPTAQPAQRISDDRTAAERPAGTRLAGLLGAAFAVSVIAQNLWTGAAGILPDPDASAADVVETFVDHNGAYAVLLGWVALNIVAISVFLAGAHHRLRRAQPIWSGVGLVGGISLIVFFAMVNLPIAALATGGESLADSPQLVDALWHMHGAAFAFAGIALGIALAGFSLAAAGAELVPRWFRTVGPVGGAVIILASVPVQAGAEGSPATMVGVLGFLIWLLFLVIFGLRIWREA
jgi:hypothetical protein